MIRNAILVFTAALHPDAPPGGPTLDDWRSTSEAMKDNYPSFANAHKGTQAALEEAAVGNDEIAVLGAAQTNPTGGFRQTGTPSWEDVDGDGGRASGKEKLFYHNADPPPTVDHWNTTTVVHKDTAYVVDSRDWFIDLDMPVERRFLKEIPGSASPDNTVNGIGSYSWYIDENAEVRIMLYSYPVAENTGGFQDLYP